MTNFILISGEKRRIDVITDIFENRYIEADGPMPSLTIPVIVQPPAAGANLSDSSSFSSGSSSNSDFITANQYIEDDRVRIVVPDYQLVICYDNVTNNFSWGIAVAIVAQRLFWV